MAVSKDDLLIAIQADTASAKVGIDQLTKSVDKLGQTMEKSSQSGSKIESALTGMAGKVIVLNQAFELAGRVYGQFIKPVVDSVVAFQNSQDAVNKLSGTLNLLGEKNIPQTVNQFVNLSNAIEDMIGVDDKAVLSMLSMAKASGLTNAQVEKLAKTAADFSVGAGIGFEQAFFALQKTLKGSALGLATFRPELKNLTEEQLKAGDAIDYISGKYQGYSQIIEKSFGMSVARASEAIDDLKKAFGGLISDFIPVQTILDSVTGVFADFAKLIKMIPKDFGALSQIYQIIKNVVGIVIEQFDTMFEFVSNGILVMVNGVLVMFNVMAGGVLQAFADLQKGLSIIGLIDKSAFQATEAAVKKLVDDTVMRVLMLEKSLKGMARAGAEAGQKVAAATTAGTGAGRPTVGGMAPMDPQYLRELETLRAKTIELQTSANSFGLTQRDQIAARLDGELKILEAQRQQYLAKKQTAAAFEIEAQMAAKRQLAAGQIEAAPSRAYESIAKAGQDAASAISGKFSEGLMGTVAGAVSAAQMVVDAIQGLIDAGPKLLQSIAKIFDSLADLPTALLDGMMAIDTALQKFIDKFPEAFANLLARLPEIITSILEKLGQFGPIIARAVIKAVPKFVVSLVKEAPKIGIAMAKGFVEAARDLINDVFSGTIFKAPKIDVSNIEKSFSSEIKKLTEEASKRFAVLDLEQAKTKGRSILQEIIQAGARSRSYLSQMWLNIVNGLSDFFKTANDFVIGIAPAFQTAWEGLKTSIGPFFQGIFDIFADLMRSLFNPERWSVIGKALQVAFNDIISSIVNLIQNLSSTIGNIGLSIVDAGRSFIHLFDDFGTVIWNGLKSAFSQLGSLITNILNGLNPNPILKKVFSLPSNWGGGRGSVEKLLGIDVPFASFAQGGIVPGKAAVAGDSILNDRILALLSPGEAVIPRSMMNAPGVKPIIDAVLNGKLSPLNLFGGVIGKVVDVVSGRGGAIETLTKPFGQIAKNVWDGLTEGAKAVSTTIGEVLKVSFDAIQQAANILGIPIDNLIDEVYRRTAGGLKSMIASQASGMMGFANGGFVPGVGSSDSVPAMLSPGEYVINRRSVGQFGSSFMDQLNAGVMPAGAGGGSTVVNVAITIENKGQLDENFIRSRLMPTIRNEFRRASLDGQFVISGKGVR